MSEIFEFGMPAKLDEKTVQYMAEKLEEAIFQGYGKNLPEIDYDTPDFEMMSSLRTDVWQFSGAKNYQQLKAMSEALEGPDGKLRSFNEFKKTVRPIIDDHARWLETEYRTAVASSQMAAKWARIQRDKDLFPLLEFDAVIDNRTTELCRSLDKVIRPVDDAFWQVYYPPNHFNCRSDVRSVRSGEITPEEDIEYPDIPDMFRTNTAANGLVFPPGHSYYADVPDDVKVQASAARGKVELERAKVKFKTVERTVARPELIKPIAISNSALKEIYQHARKKNYELVYDSLTKIDDVLKDSEYLGRTKKPDARYPELTYSHIFSVPFKNEKYYLIVNEFSDRNTPLKPYAFTKSEEIFNEIERYEKTAW